jgi:uncharacterized protein (TIGR03000 family)
MTYPRCLGFAGCALALTLALLADQAASQDTSPKPNTTLHVLVPTRGAEVRINGTVIPGRGKQRDLAAPPLAKDKDHYEVTAMWEPNNYTKFFRTRKVAPKPGQTVTADLREADPKNPDHIEIRYVPTPDDVVARMCQLGKVGKDDVVFDLGCGDGRIVITAVKDFGAKRGVGVDLDPERIRESMDNAKARGVTDRVEFRVGDVLKIKDLSDATVVMLYMGDDVNNLLQPILRKTLPKGARVVSHRFGMKDWKPDVTETFRGQDGDDYTLLVWTVK